MAREVEVFAKLREELDAKKVSKKTAQEAVNIYNQDPNVDKVTGCLCTAVKRRIIARMVLEWYEGKD